MPYIIDAHQDIAYNMLTFGRDYRRSVVETRKLEAGSPTIQHTGQTLLGWPEYQAAGIAVIFNTLFIAPRRYQGGDWDTQSYSSFDEAYRLERAQVDLYRRLADESPEQFRQIFTRRDLQAVLQAWENPITDAAKANRPTGWVTLMEGAEGVRHPDDLVEWWEAGVRTIGLVWAGTRLCGGMHEGDGFTREGYAFMEGMASIGFTLDISHMNEESARQALDFYQGAIIATHANARMLLNSNNQRHLSDAVIHKLIERGGVMGIIPFNRFLKEDWKPGDARDSVTLAHVIAQIDHVCQIAGNSRHAAIGTDFDGGYGWPSVPYEINSIADITKISPLLIEKGYTEEDVSNIFGANWRRHLERTLPE